MLIMYPYKLTSINCNKHNTENSLKMYSFIYLNKNQQFIVLLNYFYFKKMTF